MPTIYEHHKPNYRLYAFARGRMAEIDKQIRQLKLERGLMEIVVADCKAKVCPDCDGEGIVMKPIKGCECDGPRQHTCETCNGTGGVPAGVLAPGDARDAARYRWLRQQHWNEASLCVVMQPRQAVKLGHDCPALARLDAAIDEAMGANGVQGARNDEALVNTRASAPAPDGSNSLEALFQNGGTVHQAGNVGVNAPDGAKQ